MVTRSPFPSPCGVNIVANVNIVEAIASHEVNKVSVPLRGKYRGEFWAMLFDEKQRNHLASFRPLAG